MEATDLVEGEEEGMVEEEAKGGVEYQSRRPAFEYSKQ